MNLVIDHVPFAWDDLDDITAVFERLGFAPEYGGVHDNGVTEMAVLGFDDDSYIELIAERAEGDHEYWPGFIRAKAGPAAWAVRVPDIVDECHRVLDAGIPVRGPFHGTRTREDGTRVEWDRAVFGSDDRQLALPFAISDRTPLEYRVSPTPSVAGAPVSGIAQVVIAVPELDSMVGLFDRVYRLPQPHRATVPGFGRVASFPGCPIALATPEGTNESPLVERLDRFPAAPCAILLEGDDFAGAQQKYPLQDPVAWPDGRVSFVADGRIGQQLGIIDRN